MSGESDLVDVELDLKHQTGKAYLVSDGKKEAWLPKSQVEFERTSRRGGKFTMPEWLAEDKGFI